MSAVHLGFFNTSTSRTMVSVPFTTHASAGGNVAPNSAFEAADVRIYRANDSTALSGTQRSSASGITMTSPFDSLTGFHNIDIDLTDNTDAGFYASGYRYVVVLAPDETVDGQTITAQVLAYFEIGFETPDDYADAVWASASRTLTAIDEDTTTLDLDATVRAAVGLASANLDTQLSTIESQTDDIGAAGAGLTALGDTRLANLDATVSSRASQTSVNTIDDLLDTEVAAIISAIAGLNNISTAQVLTQVQAALDATVADSVPADGSRPSISQAVYMMAQRLFDCKVVGTTATVYKPDGVTPLFTMTLNDPDEPTEVTRAT